MWTCKHGYNSDDEGTGSCYPTVNDTWRQWESDTDSDTPNLSHAEYLPSEEERSDRFVIGALRGEIMKTPTDVLRHQMLVVKVDIRADIVNLRNINPNIMSSGAQPPSREVGETDTVVSTENGRFRTGSGGAQFAPQEHQPSISSSDVQGGKGATVAVSPEYPPKGAEAETHEGERVMRWRSPGSSTHSSADETNKDNESSGEEGENAGRHTKVTIEEARSDEENDSDAPNQTLSLSASEVDTADMQQIKLDHLVSGKQPSKGNLPGKPAVPLSSRSMASRGKKRRKLTLVTKQEVKEEKAKREKVENEQGEDSAGSAATRPRLDTPSGVGVEID